MLRGYALQRLSPEVDLATRWLQNSGDQAQRRSLASASWAEDDQELTLFACDAQVVDGDCLAELFGQRA
jgi:hypothetical protein